MIRILHVIWLFVLAYHLAAAQPHPSAQQFAAASIKPTPLQSGPGVSADWNVTPGGIHIANQTLSGIIIRAFGIERPQLVGPTWLLKDDRGWNIDAKAPAASSPEQISLMLQALLAERFKLLSHREKRDVQAYALVVAAGGSKMSKTSNSGGLSGERTPSGATRISGNVTMSVLAHFLENRLKAPVVEMTGLEGPFKVTMEWMPSEFERSRPAPPADNVETGAPKTSPEPGLSIFTALSSQLGLRLDRRKAPLDVLVVDHVARTATEN